MDSLSFQIVSIFYIVLISVAYFGKKKLDTLENRIYSCLIIIMYLTLFMDISSVYLALVDVANPLTNILCKLYLVSIIAWVYTFTYYIFVISSSKNDGNIVIGQNSNYSYFVKVLIIFICLFVFSTLLVLFAPLSIFSDGIIMYTYGVGTVISYIFSGICVLSWGVFIFSNINGIKNKKYIPVFLFVVLAIIAVFIQSRHKEILLVTSAAVFITILTYFTIENPDIKMIEALQLAREQADKSNRAKTDFLSSMSHEIRTPLNAIVGFSNCIDESKSLAEAKENAKDIVNASNTLLEIVNGILDISKIEAGKLEIVNSRYNAKETFIELAKLIMPKMNEKKLDFSYYIAPDLPPFLYGDCLNMKKIITNLLSNACKYTDKGFVKYEVNCINSSDKCKLIISVEDSGRGIKKESVDQLFTKFQRFEEDKNTTIEGTGLGLAITKQLVELMGGRIVVHTEYGEGSKFLVIVNQNIDNVIDDDTWVTTPTTLDLSQVKILLVDDNSLNIKVGCKILERYNAKQITSIDSGFLCLERIMAGEVYDVILLDDMMPKMSGVETLRKLREIPGFNTPVVVLTANAVTGMREKYIKDGFDDYLAKPIDREELIVVMNNVLRKNHAIAFDDTSSGDILDDEVDLVVSDNSCSCEEFLRENGVDLDKALSLLGNMEMYDMSLKDFEQESQEKWQSIKSYKEQGDLENYAILVHSLKSDAKYLGFMMLADIAYQHELKSKENDQEFVDDHFSELELEYRKVLKLTQEYIKL